MPAPESRRLVLPERGVEIALLDWGGDGPLVLMHHANGFCAGTLGLVAEGLVDRFRVIGMDARGHGRSSKPEGDAAYAWHHFAEDYLAVARRLAGEHGGRVAVALGHSFGGTSAFGAAAREPALFERLVLVDPDGHLRYSGGYTASPASTAYQDQHIAARARSGVLVRPLPAYGCPTASGSRKKLKLLRMFD